MQEKDTIKVGSFYVIISGLFRFNRNRIKRDLLHKSYTGWHERINQGNCETTFNYLNRAYYDSYIKNIFPEIRNDQSRFRTYDPSVLNHLTLKDAWQGKNGFDRMALQVRSGEEIPFRVDFADLYLFPHEIGLFSVKIQLCNPEDIVLPRISDFLNGIRFLESRLILPHEDRALPLSDFIERKVLFPIGLQGNWQFYNPQLKLYTMIDLQEEIDAEEMDSLLYDLGNITTIGSARGRGLYAPSGLYLAEQLGQNRISVFKNWSALALYDTFTRISQNFPDTYKSWEYDYFNLYIHTVYTKFFMYLTNSLLSDVTRVDKRTEKIRNSFIEFVNDYHHTQISYKFLPDLIRDKLMKALEISAEIERMETKIRRINEQFQERREKSFNLALIVITLLSVFSVIYDLSEWTIRMGASREFVYPFPSIIGIIVIFLLIYLIFKMNKK